MKAMEILPQYLEPLKKKNKKKHSMLIKPYFHGLRVDGPIHSDNSYSTFKNVELLMNQLPLTTRK